MSVEPEPQGRPIPPSPSQPRPPAPPPAALVKREESPLIEYMRARMEIIERELIKERERAASSENLMKQQEALRSDVSAHIERIGAELKAVNSVQELSEDRSEQKGRVSALEKRLDDMHSTWADLIKDTFQRLEDGRAQLTPEIRAFTEALGTLREDVRALGAGFKRLEEEAASQRAMARDLEGLRQELPLSARRREQEELALRDELRAHAERLGEVLLERLNGLDRRIAEDLHRQEERLAAMVRERAALDGTLQEEGSRARQEFLKERTSLQSLFNEQIAGVDRALAQVADRQGGANDSLTRLHGLAEALHAILTQPQKAKDHILQELESEKRDLITALKARSEQLRSYTLERREVERSLGESLMEAHRQIEAARSQGEAERHRAAELEQELRAGAARLELSHADVKDQEGRFCALASERDALLAALAEEAAKVRRQIDERADGDRAWEARVIELQRRVNEERSSKLNAESRAAELEDRLKTLSEHVAKALRDKDQVEQRHAQWSKDRQAIEAQLRKKDEMVAMLSSTFQNLLKKPQS